MQSQSKEESEEKQTTQLGDPETDQLVCQYLSQRGYTAAVSALMSESSEKFGQSLAESSQKSRHHQSRLVRSVFDSLHSSHNVQWYMDSFFTLYRWTDSLSVREYRDELEAVLLPVFVFIVLNFGVNHHFSDTYFDLTHNEEEEHSAAKSITDAFRRQIYQLDLMYRNFLRVECFFEQFRRDPRVFPVFKNAKFKRISDWLSSIFTRMTGLYGRSLVGLLHSNEISNDDDQKESQSSAVMSDGLSDEDNEDDNAAAAIDPNVESVFESERVMSEECAKVRRLVMKEPLFVHFTEHKFEVRISRVCHEMLVSWLHSCELDHIRNVVAERVHFKIISDEPSTKEDHSSRTQHCSLNDSDDDGDYNRISDSSSSMKQKKRKNIDLGVVHELDVVESRALRDAMKHWGNLHPYKGLIRDTTDLSDWQPKISHQASQRVYLQSRFRVPINQEMLPSVCEFSVSSTKEGNSWHRPSSMCVSEDGRYTACGTSESTILLFEGENRECHKLIGHSASVTCLDMDPTNDEQLLSGSLDGSVRLWSMKKHECLAHYSEAMDGRRGGMIWSVSWAPVSLYFACSGNDRMARMFCTEREYALREFVGHSGDVECVKFHPNCSYIATGSSDCSVRLWDVESGRCVRKMMGHSDRINDLCFTDDGQCLLTASDDRTLRVWDLALGRCIATLEGHSNIVTHVRCCFQTKPSTAADLSDDIIGAFPMIVSCSSDRTIRFWDLNGRRTKDSYLVKTVPMREETQPAFLNILRSNLVFSGVFE